MTVKVENAVVTHKQLLEEADSIWGSRHTYPGDELIEFASREHAEFMSAYYCTVALMAAGEYSRVAFSKYLTWLSANNWGSSEEKYFEAQAEYSALLKSAHLPKSQRKLVHDREKREIYSALTAAHDKSKADHAKIKDIVDATESRLFAEKREETRQFYATVNRATLGEPVCRISCDEAGAAAVPADFGRIPPKFEAMGDLLGE